MAARRHGEGKKRPPKGDEHPRADLKKEKEKDKDWETHKPRGSEVVAARRRVQGRGKLLEQSPRRDSKNSEHTTGVIVVLLMKTYKTRITPPSNIIGGSDPAPRIAQELLGMEISMAMVSRRLRRMVRAGKVSLRRARLAWYAERHNMLSKIRKDFSWYTKSFFSEWKIWYKQSEDATMRVVDSFRL